MNKLDIVSKVAQDADLTQKNASKVMDIIIKVISIAMINGETISLAGFGKFKVTHRKARNGRNPKTGEGITIPERKTPRFLPGKSLTESIQYQSK